jgi:type I restriction enzyme S subunit
VYGSSGIVGSHEKALVQGPGIILGRKGNVGSVYWSSKSFFPIDTVYFISAESSNLYLYYALRNMHFISTDVAVPGLNRDFAYSRPLLLPPLPLLTAFLDYVTPIRLQIDKLGKLSDKLRAARDLLLPRLMTGELLA